MSVRKRAKKIRFNEQLREARAIAIRNGVDVDAVPVTVTTDPFQGMYNNLLRMLCGDTSVPYTVVDDTPPPNRQTKKTCQSH